MASAYGRSLGLSKPGSFENPMITGYFASTDANGNIKFSGASIAERPTAVPRFEQTNQTIRPGPPDDMTIVTQGYEDIIREFGAEQSHRTRQALAGIDQFQSPLQRTAFLLGAIAAGVRDWSGNAEVGGEIAVIILEREKGWRWFSRPSFCPERKELDFAN
jgi:hypothetical protein